MTRTGQLLGAQTTEDTALSTGNQGMPMLGRRKDRPPTSTSTTDGDAVNLNLNEFGELYVDPKGPSAVTQYTASLTATGSTDAGVNRIHDIIVGNLDGTNAHYVKIYDKATAATEVDTPKLKIYVAANDTKHISLEKPLVIANGISMRATTEGADNGTTGATANDVWVTLQLDS